MCLCGGHCYSRLVNQREWEEDVLFKEPNQISLLVGIIERSERIKVVVNSDFWIKHLWTNEI